MIQLRRLAADTVALWLVLAALIAFFSWRTPHFLTPATFSTLASQIPDAVALAVGMTLVLIAGGIDLSVGSVLALSSAALGVALTQWKLPLPIGSLVGLLIGCACGAVNGLVTIRWRLPAFIVTLAMMEAARGATYLATDSRTLYLGRSVQGLAEAKLQGVPLPFLLALALVGGAQFVLARMAFGRCLVAIGTNAEAARLSGLPVARVRLTVFALSGACAALAGLMQTSRLASVDPNMGAGAELAALAAAVIGGTSLSGGRGSVVSTFLGVLIIAVLGAGLAQIGAQEPTKRLVTAAVIVAAAVADHYRQRKGACR